MRRARPSRKSARPATNPHPSDQAGLVSTLFYWWLIPFYGRARNGNVDEQFEYDVPEDLSSQCLGDRLEEAWTNELLATLDGTRKFPSLLTAICLAFGPALIILTFARVVTEACLLGSVLLMEKLVDNEVGGHDKIYFIAVSTLLTMYIILHQAWTTWATTMGIQIRVACSTLLYRKILKLDFYKIRTTEVEKLISSIQSDLVLFDMLAIRIPYVIVGPSVAAIFSFILWDYLGPSILAGLAFLGAVLIPLQVLTVKRTSQLSEAVIPDTDERVRLIKEISTGIVQIKQCGWENIFFHKAKEARRKEAATLKRSTMVHIFISVAFSQASKMMTLLTITTFVLLGNVITFSKAFLTLCAIQALRSPLCIFVPRGISLAAKLATTVENLQKLLLLNECLGVRYLREHRLITDPNNKIVLVDVCTKWHAENSKHTLSQINLSLLQGEILMVIGQSGAGKTTLLHLLMGELIHTSGVLTVTGKAVYCPQIPWLIPDTIRNNITCGKQYEEDRFQIILNVCDLKAEIHDLPEKDLTLIGDEGNIVLSSMFLAKLTLARTVYQDADIYLLDEPFAYLDQYTFMTIFNKCIWNFLKYKTVILVTDEASILQYADQILILHEGKMEGCGPYGDLISAGIEIHKYVDYDKHTDSEKDLGHCTFKQKFAHQESVIMTTNYCRRASSDNNLEMDQNVSSFKIEVIDTLGDGLTVSGSKALLTFMKAGGKVWWLVAVAVIFLFFQVLSCTWDYGFLVWTMNGTDIILEVWFAALDENHHVYLFVLWIVEMVLLVLSLIAFLCMHRVYTTASSNIHNNLVSSILQASLQCLDNSCLNKVVGTLRQDMKLLDENLPPTFMELTQYSMIILGCIITIGLANYWLFISMTIILFCCFMVGSYSLRSIRNIKKSELSKLKLVDVYFAYSMEGLSAIRAYEAEVYFRQKFVEYQDQHSSALLLLESTIQALGMWLGIFTILNIVSVITSFLLFKREFEPSFLSLALYCSLVISELAPETITYCALAAKQLGSISTILELSSLEKEIVGATAEKSNEDIPDDWPINGEIRVEDLSVRYSDDKPDVLRNVSFKILGGEKVISIKAGPDSPGV